MRETRFIAQNKEKWEEFEMLLSSSDIHPDDLQRMYIQLTDDLSFARTFYPNRSVRVYLNTLAQKVFNRLYKTKKSPAGRFLDYWRYDLPLLVWESRWEFLLALSIFLIAVFVGVISTMIDPEFPRMILSDGYVDQTLENIKKGDPMAIYKHGNQVSDALGITTNNIFVALRTFVMGVFAGIGTIFILLQNGIMVGCFQYFFVSRGFGLPSFLAIWLHGTFEISAIVIAGAAGLTLGKGLLFPGTYTRMQSFQRAARRGFEIMTGIIPLFLIAGFVEGFFTRYTDAPTIVRGGFILLCAAWIIFYFVWYPYHLSKKRISSPLDDAIIAPDNFSSFALLQIRSANEVFADSFSIFRRLLGSILSYSALFTSIYLVIFFFLSKEKPSETIVFNTNNENLFDFWANFIKQLFAPLSYFLQFFSNEHIPFLRLLNGLVLSLFANIIIIKVKKVEDENYGISFSRFLLNILFLLPATLILTLILSLNTGFAIFFSLIALLGFVMFLLWQSYKLANPLVAFTNAFSNTFGQLTYNFGVSIVLIGVGMIFFMVSSFMLLGMVMDFLSIQVHGSASFLSDFNTVIQSFVVMFSTLFIFAFFIIGGGLLNYSVEEMQNAENLLSRIEEISIKKRVKGLEIE